MDACALALSRQGTFAKQSMSTNPSSAVARTQALCATSSLPPSPRLFTPHLSCALVLRSQLICCCQGRAYLAGPRHHGPSPPVASRPDEPRIYQGPRPPGVIFNVSYVYIHAYIHIYTSVVSAAAAHTLLRRYKMQHSSHPQEMIDAVAWLRQRLPQV